MGQSGGLQEQRQTLVDRVRDCSSIYGVGLVENMGYAVGVLHEDITLYRGMIDHARGLRTPSQQAGEFNIAETLAPLSERELPAIDNYLSSLVAYLSGAPFEHVIEAADSILRLTPIPPTARIPPDSLFRTTNLGEMREQV